MKKFKLLVIALLVFAGLYSQDSRGFSFNKPPGNERDTGSTYAVIIGINKYQSPKLPELHYAAADAYAFYDFLRSKSGGNVPENHIRRFINDTATIGNINEQGLRWLLLQHIDSGSKVYLYFSGHGLTANGSDAYFLTYNLADKFTTVDIEHNAAKALYQLKQNVLRPLAKKGATVVLIFDACRSFLADSLDNSDLGGFDPELSSAQMNVGDITLLASSNGQPSFEYGNKPGKNGVNITYNHGVFTYYLLNGLMGMADDDEMPDGNITLVKLQSYLEKKVPAATGTSQVPKIIKKDQNPVLCHVDDSTLQALRLRLNSSTNPGGLLTLNLPQAGTKTDKGAAFNTIPTSVVAESNYRDFNEALHIGALWGDNGALQRFKKLEDIHPTPELLSDALLKLMAALIDSGQEITNSYLLDKEPTKEEFPRWSKEFARGVNIFDTLYKIGEKYFPGDEENKTYLQQYYFMKGRSLEKEDDDTDQNRRNESLKYLYKAYSMDTADLYILHAIDLALETKGDYKAALANELHVMAAYRNWGLGMGLLAKLYIDLKQPDSAIVYYRKAVNINPRNETECPCHLAKIFDDIGQPDSALLYYRKAIATFPKEGANYANAGFIFYGLSQPDSAIFNFRKAIELSPRYENSYYGLGDIFSDLNQTDSADWYYRKSIDINPRNAEAYYRFGYYLHILNQNDSAIWYLHKSIDTESDSAATYCELGNIYNEDLGQTDSALFYYRKAITVNPTFVAAFDGLGLALCKKKQYKEARKYYRKATQISPGDVYAYADLGFLFKTLNIRDSAIYYFRKSIEVDPKDPSSYSDLGDFFFLQKQNDSAISYYCRAMAIQPGNEDYFSNLHRLLDKSKQSKLSIRYYLEAIEMLPPDSDLIVHGYLNNDSSKKWEYTEVTPSKRHQLEDEMDMHIYGGPDIQYFREALNTNPQFEFAYYELGKIYTGLHLPDSALICYLKALDIDPKDEKAYNGLYYDVYLNLEAEAIPEKYNTYKLLLDFFKKWKNDDDAEVMQKKLEELEGTKQ